MAPGVVVMVRSQEDDDIGTPLLEQRKVQSNYCVLCALFYILLTEHVFRAWHVLAAN
jgi:hypothetical protein